LALPAGRALDILSARRSGLMDDNTIGFFAEEDDVTYVRLRNTMSAQMPNMRYELYNWSITEERNRYVYWLQQSEAWGKIDYCYLDYCGAMTPWTFDLHQKLMPGLADGAVLSCTLTYSWGTGTKYFKRMVEEHTTPEAIDQLKDEIDRLPTGDHGRFNDQKKWSRTALVSYLLWRKSWGNAPVLKQFYAYVGGDQTDGDRRGAAMISFRTWFKKPQVTP
jgi:hypothetical protein